MKLTYYYRDNCGHCRRFSKTLDQIEKERPRIKIMKIEYDSYVHMELKFIPTVVVSHKGFELGRFSSALTKKAIDNWLNQLEDYVKQYLKF